MIFIPAMYEYICIISTQFDFDFMYCVTYIIDINKE